MTTPGRHSAGSTAAGRRMPGAKYGRKIRAYFRKRDAAQGLVPWTGTPAQRARTTTDPVAFVRRPGDWDFFHDRIRGQVFVRPVPTEDDPTPKPLPHRYLKLVPVDLQKPSWLQRFKASRRRPTARGTV